MRFIATICCLMCASVACGGPTIFVGNYTAWNTDAPIIIPIMVSSSAHQLIPGLNMCVQVGDGGLFNKGINTKPIITKLDIIGAGTIFHASNIGPAAPVIQDLMALDSTLISNADWNAGLRGLDANGVLAYLTLDPMNAPRGKYQIKTHGVGANIYPNFDWNSDFADLSIVPSFVDGSITILGYHSMTWNGSWTGEGPLTFDEGSIITVSSPLTIDSWNVSSVLVKDAGSLTAFSIRSSSLTIGGVSVVPEPSSIILIGMFFCVVIFRRIA